MMERCLRLYCEQWVWNDIWWYWLPYLWDASPVLFAIVTVVVLVMIGLVLRAAYKRVTRRSGWTPANVYEPPRLLDTDLTRQPSEAFVCPAGCPCGRPSRKAAT
jgi:hypothetical protein